MLDFTFTPQLPPSYDDEDDAMMTLSFYSDCDYRSGRRREPPTAGPAVFAVVGGVLRGVWQMVPRFLWGSTNLGRETTFSETVEEQGGWVVVPVRRAGRRKRGVGRRTTVGGKRRRDVEDEVEVEMRRLESRMKSLIKEGRQALGTKVEVVYDDYDEF